LRSTYAAPTRRSADLGLAAQLPPSRPPDTKEATLVGLKCHECSVYDQQLQGPAVVAQQRKCHDAAGRTREGGGGLAARLPPSRQPGSAEVSIAVMKCH